MQRNTILAVLFVQCILLVSVSFASDWPQWRGPNRDGISQEKSWIPNWPASGPQQTWKANIGIGYGSVSIARGRLFVVGNTADVDHVFCFDANTGKQIWDQSYPCLAKDPNGKNGPRTTPTVDGDRVYTVSRAGQLFCRSFADGKTIWSKDYVKDYGAKLPQWGFSTSPLVEGNLLIVDVGSSGASAVAFDKVTGKEIWKAGDDPAAYSSPMPFDFQGNRCVAFFNTAGIVARHVKDGQELWRHPWKTKYDVNAATPIISGDKAFVSSGYNAGCVLVQFSEKPPKVLWENKNMRNHCNSCVLWDGYLYGFDEAQLKCVDFKTGEVKWSEPSYGKGSLMIADGKLIIYSDKGKVGTAEISPAAFKQISSAQVLSGTETWASPVLANGKLYCRSQGDLVCLDVSGK